MTQLGIYTHYNDEEVGFTPITQDNRLADANYYLYKRLTHKQYNSFEEQLHNSLMDGQTSGIIKIGAHTIEWEVVTEQEYYKSQADEVINISSLDEIPLSNIALKIAKLQLEAKGFYGYVSHEDEGKKKVIIILDKITHNQTLRT